MKTLHFDTGYKPVPWEIIDESFHWLCSLTEKQFEKYKGPCILQK